MSGGAAWVRRGLLRGAPAAAVLAAVTATAMACAGAGEATLTRDVVEQSVTGSADDAGDAGPADRYEGLDDPSALDSLTTAYSDPPRPGRVSGGVAAEPADTGTGGLVGSPAEARSNNRVVSVLEVTRPGTFRFDLGVELHDIELGGAGELSADAEAYLETEDGVRVPGGEIGGMTLDIHPDGSVVIDEDEMHPGEVEPNYMYSRTITGPHSGVRLETGRYRVVLELALIATAPARSGPGQLGRVGQGMATIALHE